ncbi:hypothetical protein RUM44_003745 [Polyplax serrata]|uniref:Uncharacterized protein n=1 Tax=Polyplax serrata TaxID=468196 RepID=A0ABR1AHC5_POLSC
MTSRSTELSLKDCRRKAESRLNHICPSEVKEVKDEGCPVIEESGTVCGEKETLSIFQEFRKVYEDCIKRLEETPDGAALLAKMTPFRKIVDDLWEQNNLLVEAVEELEQEATVHVTNLQNKLDKSCQKVFQCKNDIKSLMEMIRRLKEENVLDCSGLEFHTLCPECCFGNCNIKRTSGPCEIDQRRVDTSKQNFLSPRNTPLRTVINSHESLCSGKSDDNPETFREDCTEYENEDEDEDENAFTFRESHESDLLGVNPCQKPPGRRQNASVTAYNTPQKMRWNSNSDCCDIENCEDCIKLLKIGLSMSKSTKNGCCQCDCLCSRDD